MTTTRGWDDARLSVAFAAMATTTQAPADLVARTIAAVRTTSAEADRTPPRWARLLPAAAALATVTASVAIAVVLLGGPSPVGPVGTDGPSASPTPRAPVQSAAPAPPPVADLPRLSVVDLLARIDAGPTADEVIVHGWLGRTSTIVDCELVARPHPLMPHCEEFGLFLMQDEADPDGGGSSLEGPAVAFVVPMLRFDAHVDANPLPGQAVEVLAVGHVLDHRWTSCPPAAAQECRERFVIDRVMQADRAIAEDPEPWLHDAATHPVPAGVVPGIESAIGEISVVSIGALPTDAIALIEPDAELLIEQEGTELLWVVRALTTGPAQTQATTYLVPAPPLRAGNAVVYRITAAGPEELSVAAAPAPTQVFGLDVLSVMAAIDIRDAGVDDREIAVRGWFSPIGPMSCPFTPATSPVQPVCPDDWIVLMQAPESLVTRVENGFEGRAPTGPSFQIDLGDLDGIWEPGLPAVGPSMPIEVVVVGHFDDRRSFACPAAQIDRCRDRFVVDRVAFADGRSVPTSALDLVDGGAVSSAAEVEATVTETVRGAELLSMVAVDGELGLQRVEPSIGVFAPLQGQPAIWVVRLLDRCVIRCTARGAGEFGTYLVVDGTDALFKIDTNNVATQVAGKLPVPSSVPWPPDSATIVELPIDAGSGRPPVRVAVVDQTRHLVGARAATSADIAVRDITTNTVGTTDLRDGGVLVDWGGSMCDDLLILTISASEAGVPDRVTVDGRRGSPCRLALIYYAVVLEFEPAIGAADLGSRYLIGP